MVKINKKVEYALIVLQHFEQHPKDEYYTARTICELYKTPFDTTSRVMQLMNQKEILISQQGTNGGYKLNINLSDVNYMELTELIEGKNISSTCASMGCSLVASCNISGPITKLNTNLHAYFKSLTLKDLLATSPGTPAGRLL